MGKDGETGRQIASFRFASFAMTTSDEVRGKRFCGEAAKPFTPPSNKHPSLRGTTVGSGEATSIQLTDCFTTFAMTTMGKDGTTSKQIATRQWPGKLLHFIPLAMTDWERTAQPFQMPVIARRHDCLSGFDGKQSVLNWFVQSIKQYIITN
ncbi:hypothetical protein [Gaoshiqia sediminis]|uniref:Uncharacterized protein n=1 Tax=Gaoshiqia sediminis TaxID=2986998 RepID=A0AA41YAY4_9BACT|nr:hypothetical protein [Gaoshiqia sediminis]MCW0484991.1 hypothetical protein [Gaoshiqia sediminis]